MADDNMGRIKIIIAEGINHGQGPQAFDKTRNIVSFSFQHAPLRTLTCDGCLPLLKFLQIILKIAV